MKRLISGTSASLVLAGWILAPTPTLAHCDTMDGPVVIAARQALETGDPAPVLRWVRPDQEGDIRAAFTKARDVRKLSPAARDFADMYFFETLVRVHREGEGFPYTGIRPAGTPIEPSIRAADHALETGDAADLSRDLASAVSEGVQARFAKVMAARANADRSVADGRAWVEAYVAFTHYVEGIDAAASGGAHGEAHSAEPPAHQHP